MHRGLGYHLQPCRKFYELLSYENNSVCTYLCMKGKSHCSQPHPRLYFPGDSSVSFFCVQASRNHICYAILLNSHCLPLTSSMHAHWYTYFPCLAWESRCLPLCPQPSGAHCLRSFLWIRTPRFRDTTHLTHVVAETLPSHVSCLDDPVVSRVKVCLSWKTRKQLSKITLNPQENKGEMEEGWVSLVDMSEVKFLLPLVGVKHANKYRKLSR